FQTLFDLPFILLGAVVMCTGIRGVCLVRDLVYSNRKQGQVRLAVVQQFVLMLADVPAVVGLCITLATVYRTRRLYLSLRHPLTCGWFTSIYNDNLPLGKRLDSQMLCICQAMLVLLDLPFLLLGLLVTCSLWRAP